MEPASASHIADNTTGGASPYGPLDGIISGIRLTVDLRSYR